MSKKIKSPKVIYTLEKLNQKEEKCEEIARFGRLDRARKKMREEGHFSWLFRRYYTKNDEMLYIMKWENFMGGLFYTATYYN